MTHPLHKALNVPPHRQYPVLIGYSFTRRCTGEADIPRCQRRDCQHQAGFARVWLSPSEIGRFTLSALRHGTFYCTDHAREAREATSVPVLETPDVIEAYHRQVIEDATPTELAAPEPTTSEHQGKVVVTLGPRGTVMRLADDSLEVVVGDSEPVKVCCRMQARRLVGDHEPSAVMREHSRSCPNRARNR